MNGIKKKDVTDEEIVIAMEPVFEEIKQFLVLRQPKKYDPDKKYSKNSEHRKTYLSYDEKELLKNIFEKPRLGTLERQDELGMNSYTMNKVKKSLIKKGLIVQFNRNYGSSAGGIKAMLELTESGYSAIGKKPLFIKPPNMSYEHWAWQKDVFQFFKDKGFHSEIEKAINGKRADVGITRDGRNIAIEIEMTPKNSLANLIGDIQAGFDFVMICSKNIPIQREIKKRLLSYKNFHEIEGKYQMKLLTDFSFLKD